MNTKSLYFFLLGSIFFAGASHAANIFPPTYAPGATGSAKFRETRSAYYLDEPLQSEGVLQYKNGILLKTILVPEKVVQQIQGDQLRIRRGEETHSISLASEPVLSCGVNALRWALTRNETQLQAVFDIAQASKQDMWVLTLVPKDPSIRKQLPSIEIRWRDNDITDFIIMHGPEEKVHTHLYAHE